MAYDFSGSQYLAWNQLTALNGTDKATFSIWMKNAASQSNSYARFFSQCNGSNVGVQGWHEGTDGTSATMFEGTGSAYYKIATGSLSASVWTHLWIVYDGTQAVGQRWKMWVNGTSKTVTASGNAAATLGSPTASLILGAGNAGSLPIQGSMAEFAIWAGLALTDGTLISNIAAGKNPQDATNGHPTGLSFYAPLKANVTDRIAGLTNTTATATLDNGDHPIVDDPPSGGGGGGSRRISSGFLA